MENKEPDFKDTIKLMSLSNEYFKNSVQMTNEQAEALDRAFKKSLREEPEFNVDL